MSHCAPEATLKPKCFECLPGRTKMSKRNMPAWSRHVSGQEASATHEELARCGPLV